MKCAAQLVAIPDPLLNLFKPPRKGGGGVEGGQRRQRLVLSERAQRTIEILSRLPLVFFLCRPLILPPPFQSQIHGLLQHLLDPSPTPAPPQCPLCLSSNLLLPPPLSFPLR